MVTYIPHTFHQYPAYFKEIQDLFIWHLREVWRPHWDGEHAVQSVYFGTELALNTLITSVTGGYCSGLWELNSVRYCQSIHEENQL